MKYKGMLVLGTVLSFPLQAAAADAEMEEVIVTAQKRAQSIIEVPITMDVIQGEFLDNSNTTELDDLSRFLPNVVIQEQAVSLPSFNIRGITDDTASVATTPRISVYQDGVDISKKTVSSVALYDIERIEVLKGPQPTLFGVAAANGAVSIISARPTETFDMGGRVAFNNKNGVDLQGMVNIPVNDNIGIRLAGMYRDSDGTVNNKACGSDSYNPSGQIEDHTGTLQSCSGGDLNGVSVESVRATIEADYDKLNAIVRLAHEGNEQPGISFKSGSIAPRNGDTDPFTDAELGFGSLLGIDRTVESFDMAVSYALTDSMELTVDAYRKDVELTENFDADGSGLRIQDAWFENDAELSGFGARLVFNVGDRFEGFVGASRNNDESILPFRTLVDPYIRGVFDARKAELEAEFPNIPLNQNVSTDASEAQIKIVRDLLVASLFNADGTPITNPDPTAPTLVIGGPFVFEADLEINSYVAEGSFDVTDKLRLTAGLRYIDETRFTRNFGFFAAEEDFSETLPRFAINYLLSEDLSFYFNYAQGRRSPVVDPNFGNTIVTPAEKVDSYDIGFKYLGGRFAITGAVFAYTYTDYQQSFTDAVTLQSITVTVGDSDMYGFEGTIDYLIDDSFRVGASLGLLDAKFGDKTDSGAVFDYADNRFRLAPELSTSFNANKTFVVDTWEIELELLTSYQSEVFFESSNYPGLSQDGYWLSDVAVKLRPSKANWRVEVYADNLFDEEYLIDAGNTGGGLGIPTFVRGMPLVAGLRFYARL
jgi:iron complex outermembrane receptor protein